MDSEVCDRFKDSGMKHVLFTKYICFTWTFLAWKMCNQLKFVLFCFPITLGYREGWVYVG